MIRHAWGSDALLCVVAADLDDHRRLFARKRTGVITGITVNPHAYLARSLELQRTFASAGPKGCGGLAHRSGQGRQAGGFHRYAEGILRRYPPDQATRLAGLSELESELVD